MLQRLPAKMVQQEAESIEDSPAPNKRRGWKPSSQNPLIQRLSGSPYEKVAISSTPDVPELIAGFIGTETGVISPKARVFVSPNRRLNREQRETTAALNVKRVQTALRAADMGDIKPLTKFMKQFLAESLQQVLDYWQKKKVLA